MDDETFSTCNFISSTFNIVSNNSLNKYGTASLVKSELEIENIRCDTEGRVIVVDLGELTLSNIYLNSGTDTIPALGLAGRRFAVRSCLTCS